MKNLKLIQQKLVAPKGQKNKFGNYMYRSAEDILNAVKPLLGNSLLTLSDEIVEVGGRVYVKATATFTESEGKEIIISAYARESETKKGMDDSQITGSASSYARKYALNGLFLIDDTKDADTMDNRTEMISQEVKAPQRKLTEDQVKAIPTTDSIENLQKALRLYTLTKEQKEMIETRLYELT
jgi:hypothetical protein